MSVVLRLLPHGEATQWVQAWPSTWPEKIALPHPSGRNNIWLKRNEWFEQDVIPMLQQRVAEVIALPPK